MEWQPIESAPKDREVLLYFPASRPMSGRGIGHGEMMRVGALRAFPFRAPTHWIPLPPPPTRKDGE